MQVWWIFTLNWCNAHTELVKIFCCTEKCSHTSQKQIPTCRFQTLLCMCSIQADPSPSCVYGRLVRSAASMAALTFSMASSETKRVPSHQQTSRGIKEIFLYRTRLCEMCSFLPLATHKTFVVSPSSPVHMQAPLHPRLFPQQTGSRHRAASRWLCGEPGKHRLGMANISPLCLHGNIWPSQARRALRLSACEATHTAGVYGCCHGTRISTLTQVLV